MSTNDDGISMGRWAVWAAALLAGVLGLSDTALADAARVTLRDGSVIEGELVRYEPSAGVALRLGNGQTVEVEGAQIDRVEIGTPRPAPQPAPTWTQPGPAPQPGAAPAPASRAPVPEPPEVRLPGFGGVITLASVGAGVLLVGAGLFLAGYCNPYCEDELMYTTMEAVGLGLLAAGGAMVVSALAIFLPMRLKKRRRLLEAGGLSFDVRPEVTREHAGLRLVGQF